MCKNEDGYPTELFLTDEEGPLYRKQVPLDYCAEEDEEILDCHTLGRHTGRWKLIRDREKTALDRRNAI